MKNDLCRNHDSPVPEFKIILVGDGGVGKSSFIRKHLTGEFDFRYIATFPYNNIQCIKFWTNYGEISFTIWESAGSERVAPMRDYQV